MELRQYLNIVWKWLWLVILSVAIAGGSSYVASQAATPLYRTKTTLMVGRVIQNPDPNTTDMYTGQQLAYTYMQLARREPVLNGAIERLGLNMSWGVLASQVSANIVPNTQLLEINVVDSDPYRAKVLADAIAQELILQSPTGASAAVQENVEFIKEQMNDLEEKIDAAQDESLRLKQELDAANSALQIQDLENQINLLETKVSGWQETYSQLLASLQGGDINTLSVVEEATIPSSPISPNKKMNVLLASAIGFILAVGGIFLIEYLDETVKSSEIVEREIKLPTLGTIGKLPGNGYSEKVIAIQEPLSPIVEAFRSLRTNIQYSSIDQTLCTLVMTASGPGEGKSICLANLAVVMAQTDLKVILVDSDLRKPIQHEIFRLPNESGLSEAILHSRTGVRKYLQKTDIENLRIMTSGSPAPNPAKLLSSERMKGIIQDLKGEADVVLFDSPPLLLVTDSILLGTQVDGVLVVCDAGRTRVADLRQAMDELRRVRANILGVVLNRASSRRGYYYYYDRKQTPSQSQFPGFQLGRRIAGSLSRLRAKLSER